MRGLLTAAVGRFTSRRRKHKSDPRQKVFLLSPRRPKGLQAEQAALAIDRASETARECPVLAGDLMKLQNLMLGFTNDDGLDEPAEDDSRAKKGKQAKPPEPVKPLEEMTLKELLAEKVKREARHERVRSKLVQIHVGDQVAYRRYLVGRINVYQARVDRVAYLIAQHTKEPA